MLDFFIKAYLWNINVYFHSYRLFHVPFVFLNADEYELKTKMGCHFYLSTASDQSWKWNIGRYDILLCTVVTVDCRVCVSFVDTPAPFSLESHGDKQCSSMFRQLKQPRFVIYKCKETICLSYSLKCSSCSLSAMNPLGLHHKITELKTGHCQMTTDVKNGRRNRNPAISRYLISSS